ncbi:MAG: VPLPA-CTERM-specific exosortase XrtD [Alphaproteobacteria bacterium]|nr:VPLPA-CTERM-specific exosortase XrtD [Alphaproteobacteria bacterium]
MRDLRGSALFFDMTMGAALAALTVWLFAATFASLFAAWQTPEYSYGYLVPLVCLGWGCALYRERKPALRPALSGLALVGFAVGMHLFGDLAANNWLDEYAIVVAAAGFVATLMGWQALGALFPAVFFLSFAVPLPPMTQASLTAGMQLLSSTLSVAGLHLLGVPVFQEGNIIDLGSYKLQVAEACSGLRYLFPFMGFGYLFAFLFEKNNLKRVLLMLATIPIAIVMNALRIVIIGVSVDMWGIAMAEGLVHQIEGWVVFVGCIGFLFAVWWALSFVQTRVTASEKITSAASISAPHITRALVLLVVLMALACGGAKLLLADRAAAVPDRSPLIDFPLRLGDWRGQIGDLPSDQLAALKLSDYFMGDYRRDNDAEAINFYIAYYANQRRDAAPHSPLVCIPGAGWEITALRSDYRVRDASGKILLTVNRALIKNGDRQALVYFWYDERGRDLTTAAQRKWYLARDSLVRGRSDGALVRVVIGIGNGLSLGDADRKLAEFLSFALPELGRYVPD